jgi:hypothetical protein
MGARNGNPFKVNNLRKDRKIHEIYKDLYGEEFNIKRGYEIESTEYQLRLAKIVLSRIEIFFEDQPVKFVLKIKNGTLIYRGKKTRQQVIKKWGIVDEQVV